MRRKERELRIGVLLCGVQVAVQRTICAVCPRARFKLRRNRQVPVKWPSDQQVRSSCRREWGPEAGRAFARWQHSTKPEVADSRRLLLKTHDYMFVDVIELFAEGDNCDPEILRELGGTLRVRARMEEVGFIPEDGRYARRPRSRDVLAKFGIEFSEAKATCAACPALHGSDRSPACGQPGDTAHPREAIRAGLVHAHHQAREGVGRVGPGAREDLPAPPDSGASPGLLGSGRGRSAAPEDAAPEAGIPRDQGDRGSGRLAKCCAAPGNRPPPYSKLRSVALPARGHSLEYGMNNLLQRSTLHGAPDPPTMR